MIWLGNLEAGEIYSLTKIAQDLNISRTPLRDAIQRLSDEKRIDILPSRGFCLHKFTEEEIKQRYHLTISLEGYSIVRLIEKYKENPKNPYIMKLEECVDLMENGLNEEHTFKEKYNYDNVFHNTLVESLDDNFLEYLSLKDHGFFNIPDLHIYAKCLDMKVMLAFNKRTLNAIKTGNYEDGYKCMIENADYVYNIYIEQSNK